jgi:hypothetical protein
MSFGLKIVQDNKNWILVPKNNAKRYFLALESNWKTFWPEVRN